MEGIGKRLRSAVNSAATADADDDDYDVEERHKEETSLEGNKMF